MDKHLKELSKALSHALRHAPEEYGITLDKQGWTSYDGLLLALGDKRKSLRGIARSTVEQIIRESDKVRFEVQGDKIRACYGHSVEGKIQHESQKPPEYLYHGTPVANVNSIMMNGLESMGRQYVHASEDHATAVMVAKRWHKDYVILRINALDAWESGFNFFNGNDDIWMTEWVDPIFIEQI